MHYRMATFAMTTAPFDLRALEQLPARERRHLRARVAWRLLARRAPAPAPSGSGEWPATATLTIDEWQVLDGAPCWLGLESADLQRWLCRIGAVFCAPALSLWIDARRTRAARAAVGAAFMDRLMAAQDLPSPAGIAPLPNGGEAMLRGQDAAAAIEELLRATGAAVIVNAMGRGALRQAVSGALTPIAELVMPAAHAGRLLQRAVEIAAADATLPHGEVATEQAEPTHAPDGVERAAA